MNRMVIVALIMLGTAGAGGGGAYYYTATHPDAPTMQSILAQAAGAPPPAAAVAGQSFEDLAAANAAAEAASANEALLPAGLGEGAPAGGAPLLEGPLTLETALSGFDPATSRLVWILPPGVKAKGPFKADIVVGHGGEKKLARSISFTPEYPQPGSRAEYPRSAQAVRLAPDATWSKTVLEIKAAVAELRLKHGPAGAEVSVESDFRTEIDPDAKADYCADPEAMPETRLYLDDGAPLLKKIDITDTQLRFRTALRSGCKP